MGNKTYCDKLKNLKRQAQTATERADLPNPWGRTLVLSFSFYGGILPVSAHFALQLVVDDLEPCCRVFLSPALEDFEETVSTEDKRHEVCRHAWRLCLSLVLCSHFFKLHITLLGFPYCKIDVFYLSRCSSQPFDFSIALRRQLQKHCGFHAKFALWTS
jgi:hypothetical protein